ncbi:hypothetical protein M409DRAFT_22344 [Zasmidium cellare ATCC 36951]|uniref:Uncharacterized protein n=1 Tax=Zasmidium cellare ATCC 36951 TaxID=1080233 RepID=A0A6A6CJX7_ZASCE|nr:uncharacterized protein M409DRAFT_22344 [Zasmidium cellare ATCC 36951]KAF2167537.1 hypothetical protein M409DRAFT_22344 [Zasmidium cellare ATCC 36951]
MSDSTAGHAKGKGVNLQDVSTAEDSRLFMVSPTGDPVFARKVATAARSNLCAGQVSDETTQKLSQDSAQIATTFGTSSRAPLPTTFVDRNGKGRVVGLNDSNNQSSKQTQ